MQTQWSLGGLVLIVVSALTACSDSAITDGMSRGADADGGQVAAESCIADYATHPCDLLTAELVRRHLPNAPVEMEQTDIGAKMESLGMSKSIGGMAQNGCTYSWEGGRTKSFKSPSIKTGNSEMDQQMAAALGKMTRDLPIDDTVSFKSIRAIEAEDPVARFERQWRAPTEEERRMLAERMDEKMDEVRAEGELSESGAEMGKSLGQSFANAAISYEAVEGVGTAARWGGLGSERELRVLDGSTEFAVVVDAADDEAANRELAIAIARDLLASCDG